MAWGGIRIGILLPGLQAQESFYFPICIKWTLFLTFFNSTLSYFVAISTLLCSFKFEFHFLPPSFSALICSFNSTSYSHFLAISSLNDCSLVVLEVNSILAVDVASTCNSEVFCGWSWSPIPNWTFISNFFWLYSFLFLDNSYFTLLIQIWVSFSPSLPFYFDLLIWFNLDVTSTCNSKVFWLILDLKYEPFVQHMAGAEVWAIELF